MAYAEVYLCKQLCHLLWPSYGIGQAIILLLCGFYLSSSLFLGFFLVESKGLQTGCLPYFYTWCCLSANLECRSEMCCMRLAENTGCKNDAKICHLRANTPLCQAISVQLRHALTIGKKPVKQQYLLHMSPQYAELRPTNS